MCIRFSRFRACTPGHALLQGNPMARRGHGVACEHFYKSNKLKAPERKQHSTQYAELTQGGQTSRWTPSAAAPSPATCYGASLFSPGSQAGASPPYQRCF